jgi:hypothetical protein
VAYTNAQGRRQLLDSLGAATEQIGVALANLGEAYEQLDTTAADRLEERLFRPLQTAYGQAQRASSEFAARYGLPTSALTAPRVQVREHDANGIIGRAAAAVAGADAELATLQDSMLPVEVGDPPLRAALEQVRVLLGDFGSHTRELTRTLGR